MQVIIAEKPSLAKNIAQSIKHMDNFVYNKSGYYEGNQYIIIPAYGHLFGLKDLDDYFPPMPDGKKRPWTMDILPFYPKNNNFEFELKKDPKTKKVDSGVKERFELIKKLIHRPDVDAVISAGDADREGECIVRFIIDYAGNTKPVYRMWFPEQTEAYFIEGLKNLKPDSDYDNLYYEGVSRTYIDWLYGINFTRYASIKSGKLLRSGRVISAIVKAIYDRDMEIRNFVPVPYYVATSKELTSGEEILLNSKKQFNGDDKAGVDALCARYNAAGAKVINKTTKKAEIGPGKLFNLSTLQGTMGKKAKLSPAETLALVQKLYEAGYVSYPRTNSQYLGPSEMGRVDAVINALKKEGYNIVQKPKNKNIYDASKIESHSALIPTYKVPTGLTGMEKTVYETIRDRFVAVFCAEPCTVDRTVITIKVDDEEFEIKGDIYATKGWKAYEAVKTNDVTLPNLNIGDSVNIDFKPVEKATTPPNHYNVETLAKYLNNPFKDEVKNLDDSEEDDADEYKAILEGSAIGTEATRASIIDNARANGYIQFKNNVYTILPDGEYMIEVLDKLGIDLSKNATARMGKTLKAVYRGDMTVDESIAIAKEEIDKAFSNKDTASIQKAAYSRNLPEIGKCPYCGGSVVETSKAFGCTTKGCKFVLWKENRLLEAMGKKMTKTVAQQFIKNKYAEMKGCTSKKGTKYDCFIVLDDSGERLAMNISFNDPTPKTGSPVGKCLICGKDMYETKLGFACEDAACGAILKKKHPYYQQTMDINRSKAVSLLNGERVIFKLKSRQGKTYEGYLILEANGKYLNLKADGFPSSK